MRHSYTIKQQKDEGHGSFNVYDRALPKELAWIETCNTQEEADAVVEERVKYDAIYNTSHGNRDDV